MTKRKTGKTTRSMAESKSGTQGMGSTPVQKMPAGAKQKTMDAMLKGMRGGGKKLN